MGDMARIDVVNLQNRASPRSRISAQKLDEHDTAAHLYDGEILFNMLDLDIDGILDRRDARSWFRGMGWCLDDAAVDSMLDEACDDEASEDSEGPPVDAAGHSAVEAQLLAYGFSLDEQEAYRKQKREEAEANKFWRLLQLLQGAEDNHESCGPNGGELLRALRIMTRADQEDVVERNFLLESCSRHADKGGCTQAELRELLELCGVPSKA